MSALVRFQYTTTTNYTNDRALYSKGRIQTKLIILSVFELEKLNLHKNWVELIELIGAIIVNISAYFLFQF